MLYTKRSVIVNAMVLWYLQALLGNGAHLFNAVQGNERDVEEQMIFLNDHWVVSKSEHNLTLFR